MSLTIKNVEKLFDNLKTGDNAKFFENVARDVEWQVMGTHPLAGIYKSKEDFISKTFERLNKLLKKE
ncbi:MAG: hypothetical protein ACXVHT_11210 [Methanobacterium sp.]